MTSAGMDVSRAGGNESRPLVPVAPLFAALALTGVAFWPGIRDMVGRWMNPNGYYGHGPLVPIASAWFIWLKRERLRRIPYGSSAIGWLFIVPSILVLVVSLAQDVHFTQNFAFVFTLIGLGYLFFGRAFMRETWFAWFFLLLMVPLPQALIANTTFEMKMLAAKLSVRIMDVLGIPAVLDGSTIQFVTDGKFTAVTVDDVCSGLRTLISLLAIAIVFAYLEPNRIKAALTLLLAAPVAIVANVVRILVLCYFASIDHPAAHEGPMHEATGLAVYAVALLLLMGIRSLPIGGDGVADKEQASEPEPGEPNKPLRVASPPRLALALLFVVLGGGAAASATLSFGQPKLAQTTATRTIPREVAGWRGSDVPVRERVYELLETRDVLIRRYQRPGQEGPVDLYVVHAADSRKVAHPPEICFSGGGFDRDVREVVELAYGDERIPAVRMVMRKGPLTLLVYYWYRIDGRFTASYLGFEFTNLLKQFTRKRSEGSMIRVSSPVLPGESLERTERRIERFVRTALPEALEDVP